MEQVPRPWSAYLGCCPNDVARPDGGHQPLHPPQRQGRCTASCRCRGRLGLLHGAGPSQHFPAGPGRGFPGNPADADLCELPAGRAAFVHRLPRASQPGPHQSPAAVPRFPPRPRSNRSPARRSLGPSIMPPTCSRFSTAIVCRATMPSRPRAHLDLGGELTDLFCRSYENIIHKDLVGYIQEFIGPKPEGADGMGYAPATPALHLRLAPEQADRGPPQGPLRCAAAARGFHPPGHLGRCQRPVLRQLFWPAESHVPRSARFPPRSYLAIRLGNSAQLHHEQPSAIDPYGTSDHLHFGSFFCGLDHGTRSGPCRRCPGHRTRRGRVHAGGGAALAAGRLCLGPAGRGADGCRRGRRHRAAGGRAAGRAGRGGPPLDDPSNHGRQNLPARKRRSLRMAHSGPAIGRHPGRLGPPAAGLRRALAGRARGRRRPARAIPHGRQPRAAPGVVGQSGRLAPLEPGRIQRPTRRAQQRIAFAIDQPVDGKYTVAIEDARGRRIRNLVSGQPAAQAACWSNGTGWTTTAAWCRRANTAGGRLRIRASPRITCSPFTITAVRPGATARRAASGSPTTATRSPRPPSAIASIWPPRWPSRGTPSCRSIRGE